MGENKPVGNESNGRKKERNLKDRKAGRNEKDIGSKRNEIRSKNSGSS